MLLRVAPLSFFPPSQRYKSSWDGVSLTRKLGERLEKSMKNQDINKYAFVFDAIDKLIASRRVLQWSYALAYYCKSGGQKSLFEYQQEMLCGATEALQDIMDQHTTSADLEKLLDMRKDVINKTSSIDKFRMEMVNQVERGEFEDLLLSQADTVLERWACTACKTDNAQKVTVRTTHETHAKAAWHETCVRSHSTLTRLVLSFACFSSSPSLLSTA